MYAIDYDVIKISALDYDVINHDIMFKIKILLRLRGFAPGGNFIIVTPKGVTY